MTKARECSICHSWLWPSGPENLGIAAAGVHLALAHPEKWVEAQAQEADGGISIDDFLAMLAPKLASLGLVPGDLDSIGRFLQRGGPTGLHDVPPEGVSRGALEVALMLAGSAVGDALRAAGAVPVPPPDADRIWARVRGEEAD